MGYQKSWKWYAELHLSFVLIVVSLADYNLCISIGVLYYSLYMSFYNVAGTLFPLYVKILDAHRWGFWRHHLVAMFTKILQLGTALLLLSSLEFPFCTMMFLVHAVQGKVEKIIDNTKNDCERVETCSFVADAVVILGTCAVAIAVWKAPSWDQVTE